MILATALVAAAQSGLTPAQRAELQSMFIPNSLSSVDGRVLLPRSVPLDRLAPGVSLGSDLTAHTSQTTNAHGGFVPASQMVSTNVLVLKDVPIVQTNSSGLVTNVVILTETIAVWLKQ